MRGFITLVAKGFSLLTELYYEGQKLEHSVLFQDVSYSSYFGQLMNGGCCKTKLIQSVFSMLGHTYIKHIQVYAKVVTNRFKGKMVQYPKIFLINCNNVVAFPVLCCVDDKVT